MLIYKVKNEEKGDVMEERILSGLSIFKLKMMLASSEMKNFTLAVNELAKREEPEAYEAMKRYINHKDKYKRLYVLKKIFSHPCAAELIPWLEENIASGEEYFSENGLEVVAKFGLKIDRKLLLAAVEKYLQCGTGYDVLSALGTLEPTEENFRVMLVLFEKAVKSGQKEVLAEIICEKYLPEKADELFRLFAASDFAKIRVTAANIGKKYGFDLEKLKYDKNCHVRKIAEMNLGELEFLRKYTKDYKVEFSENMENAIIVNPHKDEHIEIDFDHGTDWEEYTVSFPGMHAHFDYSEDTEEYIDDILSGKECSVSYFYGGEWRMSASMDSAEFAKLTYEEICEVLLNGEPEDPENAKIEIRGFSPENNYDVTFEEKNGKFFIIKQKV